MPDSRLNGPERGMQPGFIKWLFLLPFLLVLERDQSDEWPDRRARLPAVAQVRLRPLSPPARDPGGVPIGALWQMTSAERRFGGLSGLAVVGDDLLAISDSGVSVRWPKAGGLARFRDLPAGPGLPQWKLNRDAEALVRDQAGRGWWVTFEQHHSLYLFDQSLTRTLQRRPLKLRTWWRNWGIEAAVAEEGGGLLLLPENGGSAIRIRPAGESRRTVETPAQIADAARLADGRIVVALRKARPWGISNTLAWLRREGGSYVVLPWGRLSLGPWDNVEGLAAEPLQDGRTRLWFVTDSDFRRRTLLGFVEISAPAAPAQARATGG